MNNSDYDVNDDETKSNLSKSQMAMSSALTKVYRQVSRSLSTSTDDGTHNKNEVRSKAGTSKSILIEQQGKNFFFELK